MSIETRVVAAIKQLVPNTTTLVLSGRNGNIPKSDYCLIQLLDETNRSTDVKMYSESLDRYYNQVDVESVVRLTFHGYSDGDSDSTSKYVQNVINTHFGKKCFYDQGISIKHISKRLRFDEFLDTSTFVRYVIDLELSYHDIFVYEDVKISEITSEYNLVSETEISGVITVVKPLPDVEYWQFYSGDAVQFESGNNVGLNNG